MTNLSPKVKHSDRLYYDRWRYSVRISLFGSHILRGIRTPRLRFGDIAEHVRQYFRGEVKRSLLERAYLILTELEDVRVTVNADHIIVYCNNLLFTHNLDKLNVTYRLTEIVINRPRDTIIRKNSEFGYRIRFKHNTDHETLRPNVISFLDTYGDEVCACGALQEWLDHAIIHYSVSMSHYFIDVNDVKLAMLFDLMVPGMRGKTYTILSEPPMINSVLGDTNEDIIN